jgi:hypothetical protein
MEIYNTYASSTEEEPQKHYMVITSRMEDVET